MMQAMLARACGAGMGWAGLPPACRRAHLLPTWGPRSTCIKIMIPKILSDRTYLTRDQLELIKAMVVKRTPFSLEVGEGVW